MSFHLEIKEKTVQRPIPVIFNMWSTGRARVSETRSTAQSDWDTARPARDASMIIIILRSFKIITSARYESGVARLISQRASHKRVL